MQSNMLRNLISRLESTQVWNCRCYTVLSAKHKYQYCDVRSKDRGKEYSTMSPRPYNQALWSQLTKCTFSTETQNSKKDPTKKKQPKLRVATKDLGEHVYTGNFNTGVTLAKAFSLSSSALGLCLLPWLNAEMSSGGLIFRVAMTSAAGFFILITPVIIHFIAKQYVMAMFWEKKTNTFSAVKLNFFAQQKLFKFTPDQIENTVSNPLCTMKVGENGFLMDTDELMDTNLEAYVAFMRYDEPIDLSQYKVVPKKGNSDEEK